MYVYKLHAWCLMSLTNRAPLQPIKRNPGYITTWDEWTLHSCTALTEITAAGRVRPWREKVNAVQKH